MIIELKIPSPGESITEVELASWLVENGDIVEKDQEIAEVESDKATLPLVAEEGGKISLKAEAGDTLKVGDIACTIDTDFAGKGETQKKDKSQPTRQVEKPDKKEVPAQKEEKNAPPAEQKAQKGSTETDNVKVSPLAQKLMEENHLSVNDIIQGLRRITRQDVETVLQEGIGDHPSVLAGAKTASASREVQKNRISSLRRKLAQRLVAVKNETAMLTTFNEVDMSAVMNLRKKYQQAFMEKHGIKLGFMSFFTKAVTEALKLHPNVNSMIDGEDLITPSYMDIGIAVQTDKGLMVPVIRNAESLSLAEIEKHIMELATKARKNRISIEEMTGGTFTITNGGIFGSMMSTPVLNPPQSGILGMHNIVERPVAIDGKVEIRPMMYIALSYDHRVIDGKDSVGFLVKIKQFIENPHTLLFGGHEPDKLLLDL